MDPADIAALVEEQRKYFASGVTRDVSFRRAQLERFKGMIRANEDRIQRAVLESGMPGAKDLLG